MAAPFPPEQVKSRPGKFGKPLLYIDARTARRRLNEVLGPQNWSCEIEASERWVKCNLTLWLPSPEGYPAEKRAVFREALGGYPDMPSEEDRVKGGDSDAFKRACAAFGIGEYLYGDEISSDRHEPPVRPSVSSYPPSRPQVGGWFPPSTKDAASSPLVWPRDGGQCWGWVMKIKDRFEWPSILEEIKENFINHPSYKYPFKYREWDSHMVEVVATWVAEQCAKTETYQGEFDDHIGAKK